jgi:hyperosmotically inducible protein
MKQLLSLMTLLTLGGASLPAGTTLEDRVRHELRMLPYVSVFDNIEMKVDGSTVTLSGAVTQPIRKSEAENVVKRLEGVATVRNEIEVLPLSPYDDRVRLAALRRVYSWPSVSALAAIPNPPVRILVKNGNITLVGVVLRESDRDAINILANQVPGAFSVTNNLTVELHPKAKG